MSWRLSNAMLLALMLAACQPMSETKSSESGSAESSAGLQSGAATPTAQAGDDRTALGSRVIYPQSRSQALRPALILLPFTGGTPQQLYDWHYTTLLPALAAEQNLLIDIPDVIGSAEDYNTGAAWTATLARYTQGIAADAAELVQKHGADPKRIYLAGFSEGGDLAWALVQRDPDRYAGAVVMGSRASYRAKGALEKLAANGARLALFMGDSEGQDRLAGMASARKALDHVQLPYRTFSAPGEHMAAPAPVFDEALRYLLGADRSATLPPPPPDLPVAPAAAEEKPVAASAVTIVEKLPECSLVPFEDEHTHRMGYKDARGKVVIPPKLQMAQDFTELGLAMAVKGEQIGYINCQGKFFTAFVYDNGPDGFHEGLVRIGQRGRIGYANLDGQTVIAPKFVEADPFCRGVARVEVPCAAGGPSLNQCSNERYIDRTGQFIAAPDPKPVQGRCDVAESTERMEQLPTCDWRPYSESSTTPLPGEEAGPPLMGYRDSTGKIVVKAQFTEARAFGADGLAPVLDNYDAAYINCQGKKFSVFNNGGPDRFHEGLVRYAGDSMGFRNRAGQIVIPGDYSYVGPFCHGVARVCPEGDAEDRDGNGGSLIKVECDHWQTIDLQGRSVKPTGHEADCGL